MTQDEEHLRLLSIFHYVVGGLAALFSLIPFFHLIVGLVLIFAPQRLDGRGAPPPAFIGWFFVIFASVAITLGMIFAVLVLINGSFLAKRKHPQFCLVMGGVECLFMPFGTVLGIFTILVMSRESVKRSFSLPNPGPPPVFPDAQAG